MVVLKDGAYVREVSMETTLEEDIQATAILTAAMTAAYRMGAKGEPIEDRPLEHTLWRKLCNVISVDV